MPWPNGIKPSRALFNIREIHRCKGARNMTAIQYSVFTKPWKDVTVDELDNVLSV